MRKLIAGVVLLLSIGMLLLGGYRVLQYYLQESESAGTYEQLRELHGEEPKNSEGQKEENVDLEQVTADSELVLDEGLLALHEENPDCIGWIRIEGTAIDYPVMYHPEEKEYYLHRNFYGEYDYSGTPYLAEICQPETSDNLIIYGHHMNSGTMFSDLEKYKSEEFYLEHMTIEYHTLHGNEEYQIIAAFALPVYTGSDFAYYDFAVAESAEAYAEFIRNCKERAIYETGISADYGDQLITLSTCEYSHKNGRMVLIGKRIDASQD